MQQAPIVWGKVLYKRQPFEDNHVDPDKFLLEMKKNAHVEYYDFWQLVHHTSNIIQQLAIVVLFVIVFRFIRLQEISTDFLFTVNACIVFLWLLTRIYVASHLLLQHLRVIVVFMVVVLFLSPLIRTLTLNFASDTIWALTIMLLSIHLVLYEYQADGETPLMAISTNLAMFAAVLLSSRLDTVEGTFNFLGFSMIVFALIPTLRRELREASRAGFTATTLGLVALSVWGLAQFFPMLAAMFLGAVLSIAFLLPRCMLLMQASSKFQISGPWDEAVPKTSASVEEWRNTGLLQ